MLHGQYYYSLNNGNVIVHYVDIDTEEEFTEYQETLLGKIGTDYLPNMVAFKGYSDNLNWLTTIGIYHYDVNTNLRPSQYGVVLVLRNNNGTQFDGASWIFQIAFSTDVRHIYYRASINATTNQADTAWSEWASIVFGSISGTTVSLSDH